MAGQVKATFLDGLSLERSEDGLAWEPVAVEDAARRLANCYEDLPIVRQTLERGFQVPTGWAHYRLAKATGETQPSALTKEEEATEAGDRR